MRVRIESGGSPTVLIPNDEFAIWAVVVFDDRGFALAVGKCTQLLEGGGVRLFTFARPRVFREGLATHYSIVREDREPYGRDKITPACEVRKGQTIHGLDRVEISHQTGKEK